MVSGVSDVNQLQIMRATQAFKKAIQSSPNLSSIINENKIEEPDVKVSLSLKAESLKNTSNSSLKNIENPMGTQKEKYINEVKEFASKYGKNNISDEDITYALKYGRSILADHRA